MRTEYLQPQDLPALLQGTGITAEDILDETRPFSQEERAVLAEKLHIEPKDLLVSEYDEKAQVPVQRHDPAIARRYPNSDTPQYLIHPLVRSPWMPHMKGFNIDVLTPEPDLETGFESPLHQYLFNYGDTPIDIAWTVDGHTHQDTLGPEDSVYLQPCDCSGATQQTTELAGYMAGGLPCAACIGTQTISHQGVGSHKFPRST